MELFEGIASLNYREYMRNSRGGNELTIRDLENALSIIIQATIS